MPPAAPNRHLQAPPVPPASVPPSPEAPTLDSSEDGSLVAEYGLLAILGATITGLAIKWASGGAIFSLFGAVFDKVRALVGAG